MCQANSFFMTRIYLRILRKMDARQKIWYTVYCIDYTHIISMKSIVIVDLDTNNWNIMICYITSKYALINTYMNIGTYVCLDGIISVTIFWLALLENVKKKSYYTLKNFLGWGLNVYKRSWSMFYFMIIIENNWMLINVY